VILIAMSLLTWREQLQMAISRGNVGEVKMTLDSLQPGEIDKRLFTGQTPLIMAIVQHKVDIVKLLLNYCASPRQRSPLYAENPFAKVSPITKFAKPVSPLTAAVNVKCWEAVELLLVTLDVVDLSEDFDGGLQGLMAAAAMWSTTVFL
jgi:hypothetical protein